MTTKEHKTEPTAEREVHVAAGHPGTRPGPDRDLPDPGPEGLPLETFDATGQAGTPSGPPIVGGMPPVPPEPGGRDPEVEHLLAEGHLQDYPPPPVEPPVEPPVRRDTRDTHDKGKHHK
jgi:hypothetical protein